MVNTDKAFENGLKKAGLSLDLRGADFDKVDPIRARQRRSLVRIWMHTSEEDLV